MELTVEERALLDVLALAGTEGMVRTEMDDVSLRRVVTLLKLGFVDNAPMRLVISQAGIDFLNA